MPPYCPFYRRFGHLDAECFHKHPMLCPVKEASKDPSKTQDSRQVYINQSSVGADGGLSKELGTSSAVKRSTPESIRVGREQEQLQRGAHLPIRFWMYLHFAKP